MIRRINDEQAGFIADVSKLIAMDALKDPSLVPDLSANKTLMLFSDYSTGRFYSTYSFLLCGWNSMAEFAARRNAVRERFRIGKRRMSFKQMNDKLKRRALPEFLRAAGSVKGILLTFAIDERIQFMFAEQFLELDRAFFSTVKKRVLEDMLRIVHFGGQTVLTAFSPSQNILWVTDSDAIVANEDCEQLFGKLAEASLRTQFLKNESVGKIGFAVTSNDNASLDLEDFTAIPDLVAGALAETLSSLASGGLQVTAKVCLDRPPVSGKTNAICQWISLDSPLKQLCVVFDKFGQGPLDWRPATFRIAQQRNLVEDF